MGLIDQTSRINTALTEANRIKQEKEAERRRKQQEKENTERLKKDIKKSLETEFYKYFNIYGSEYITEFYSIKRKDAILQDILKQFGKLKEIKLQGQKIIVIENKEQIQDIFNKSYYKILNEQQQIFKKYDLYLQELKQEQEEQEQEEAERIQQQEEQRQKIWRIAEATGKAAIKILIFILLGIITLITAALKSSK